ncbi:MAG TPA: HAMP domain-containing sensor histidine kinase [Chloroflexota bacterium]
MSFATLVGPARSPRQQISPCESELLATVAHELRNPLASLRLSLDMLVHEFDSLEPDYALRLIQRAQRSTVWLQALTNNLTSAAAIEAGRLQVESASIDLRACIDEAIALVHALLEQRAQCVRTTTSVKSEIVNADRARVIQVIANLLSNASRYSVDGDEIELHVSSVGQHLRVRVTDHGPGISPEDQSRIFGAWVRGGGSAPGGLGLGLSIVQDLVQQLGGRVGVESTLGDGATFWFTLPTPRGKQEGDVHP